MKISKIYKKYKIMPQLQAHLLHVAAVASIICDNLEKKLDKNAVISACLLHDIGNIVKFKLDLFPEGLEPKGINYWQKVKQEFIEKYGNDDHQVTNKICKELNIGKKVMNVITNFGFSNAEKIYLTNNYETKVSVYSDMRVSPTGITSLEQRLSEAKNRYLKKKKHAYTLKDFNKYIPLWTKIEKQIFRQSKIKPSNINNKNVKPLVKSLQSFEIQPS